MALVKCPDCRTEVSNVAPACPKCGRRLRASTAAKATGCAAGGCATGVVMIGSVGLVVFLVGMFLVGQFMVQRAERAEKAQKASSDSTGPASSPPATGTERDVVASGNKAHDLLARQSDARRNQTLSAFLTKSGERCDFVERTFFQGLDKSRSAFWNVACHSGERYLITVSNDAKGSTKVLDCGLLKAVAGV